VSSLGVRGVDSVAEAPPEEAGGLAGEWDLGEAGDLAEVPEGVVVREVAVVTGGANIKSSIL